MKIVIKRSKYWDHEYSIEEICDKAIGVFYDLSGLFYIIINDLNDRYSGITLRWLDDGFEYHSDFDAIKDASFTSTKPKMGNVLEDLRGLLRFFVSLADQTETIHLCAVCEREVTTNIPSGINLCEEHNKEFQLLQKERYSEFMEKYDNPKCETVGGITK